MRTTIRIDDELYREIKAAAATSGRTVATVLEDAVRVGMRHRSDRGGGTAFRVVPYGGSGAVPGVDLSSSASISEALDADGAPDAMR